MGEDILDRIKASDRDAVSTGFRSSVQVLANEAATEIASLRARLEEAEKDSERCRDREGLHRVAEKRAFVEGWAASRSGDFQLMSQAWSAYQDALALEESRDD